MKRVTILVLISLFFGIAANAQTSQRQKIIHMAAVRIAETIQIQDSDKEAFIVLYQNYKKGECRYYGRQDPAERDSAASTR